LFWSASGRRGARRVERNRRSYLKYIMNLRRLIFLSVSLDNNEMAWKNSIEKDGTGALMNVGDMKGWKSDAAVAYHIRSIPSSVLVNGEGKIIGINLHSKDLRKKLKQMKKGGWLWF